MPREIEIIGIICSKNFSDSKLIIDYVNYLYREELGIHPSIIVCRKNEYLDSVAKTRAKQWGMYHKDVDSRELLKITHRLIFFWDGNDKKIEKLINKALEIKKSMNIFIRHEQ